MPARLRYNSSAAARKYNDENNSYDGGRARALYDTSTGAPPDFGNVCAHGYPVYNAAANHRYGVASVGGGRRAAGIVFDPGRLYPAKSFRACRRGVRPARRGSAGLCAGAAYGAVRAEDVSQ